MEVRILGPVDVATNGQRVVIDVAKERAVLEVLAVQTGRPVPVHELVTALWGDDPPPTAEKTLQGHVSRLRRVIGAATIATDAPGYTLRVDDDAVDVRRFERLVHDGRRALADGDAQLAKNTLVDALSLWRGEPLVDLADSALRQGEQVRLDELHLAAREGVIEAALALGDDAEVIADLEALVALHPLREPLWGDLMVALYRSGRQADALAAYQRVRGVLRDQLGIDPSPALQRIETDIIRQDPRLERRPLPPPFNVPEALTTFIGRPGAVDAVAAAVLERRLVTLTGTGGVGKTRLAAETARALRRRFPDGVWWVDLAPVTGDDAVAARIATTLGARPAMHPSVVDAVVAIVRRRELLLVLDNCAHLTAPVRDAVTHILVAAPDVRVLVTSRVAIDIPGEFRVPVAPLDEEYAVELFLTRARERGLSVEGATNLDAVRSLVRDLSGLPLAIELAAAQLPHASPTAMGARLHASLDVLHAATAIGDERHRTLTAALDWSYALLDGDARLALDRAGVFPAAFDLDAVRAVIGRHAMSGARAVAAAAALVDASMLTVDAAGGAPRYRLLETIRTYAIGHLTPRQLAGARQRHADHYRAFARDLVDLVGPESDAPDNGEWRHRLVDEEINLQAAVRWSLAHDARPVTLEFGPTIGWLQFMRGDCVGAERDLTAMLAGADGAPARLRALTLLRLMYAQTMRGEFEEARDSSYAAAVLAADAGDANLGAWAVWSFGLIRELTTGAIDEALPYYARASAMAHGAGRPVSAARLDVLNARQLAMADRADDGLLGALHAAERVLVAARDPDISSVDIAKMLIATASGDADGLEQAARGFLAHAKEGERGDSEAYIGLGMAKVLRGDLEAARRHLLVAVETLTELGNIVERGVALQNVARVAAAMGRPVEAARLYGAGTALTPVWPLYRRLHQPFLDQLRATLGARFEDEVAAGRRLTPDEIAVLARLDDADGRPSVPTRGDR